MLVMEAFLAKMKEYLNMDSELPYPEFAEYFQDVISYLNKNYDGFDQDTCIKARFITSILQANSEDRAKHKSPNAKKFKKMTEKTHLWTDAINYRLLKEGMTQEQIDAAIKEISDAM